MRSSSTFITSHWRAGSSISIYPQPDDGITMYARDITETRKTEQALRKSEQLAAAGRLAASIAHEINNPLEAVTNLLYLASMDETVYRQYQKPA